MFTAAFPVGDGAEAPDEVADGLPELAPEPEAAGVEEDPVAEATGADELVTEKPAAVGAVYGGLVEEAV